MQHTETLKEHQRLRQKLSEFHQCTDTHEQALNRISELEHELGKAHKTISHMESLKISEQTANTCSLYDKLVGKMSGSKYEKPMVTIDLTEDDSISKTAVFTSHNKIKKYIRINRIINKIQKAKKRQNVYLANISLRKKQLNLVSELKNCHQELELRRVLHDNDTQRLQEEILQRESHLKVIFEKYEVSQKDLHERMLQACELVDLVKYNAESINITQEVGHQENTCDVTIKGHYKVESASPLIEGLLGVDSIHGEGNGKIKIDKLHLKFDFPFYAQKRDDGEIYIKCIYDLIKYDYEIRGKVGFFADNLYMGDQEVSKPIIELLNENWRFVMSAFGQPFVDKAMEFYFRFAGFFFDNVPARHYIIEDLSPYAKP